MFKTSNLVENLFIDGIQLITGIRNNMKNQIMSMYDKIMLRKRSIIETVNDELKNICQIEHSRHRSFHNFISNLISGLCVFLLARKTKYKVRNGSCQQPNRSFLEHCLYRTQVTKQKFKYICGYPSFCPDTIRDYIQDDKYTILPI